MTSAAAPEPPEVDPFDLPDWVGTDQVIWSADPRRGGAVGADGAGAHLAPGELTGHGGQRLGCDLLAVDQAYPAPVVGELTRRRAHQAWRHGQVLVVQGPVDARTEARPTLAVPGTTHPTEQVLEALTRLARAVGADPARWSVRLPLG